MVKLSEILKTPEEEQQPFYYGVDVDEESFTPPNGVRGMAFLLKQDNGDIDEILMDVIISYALSGLEVLLEIPADADNVDAKYYLSLAANAGFSLSLLTPESESDEQKSAYVTRIQDFTTAYFGQPNMSTFVYPVTSFVEYLFVETLKDASTYKPTDPYIIERFVETTSEELVDTFKEAIRAQTYALFEGEEGFRNFAKALMYKIYQQTEENCKDVVSSMAAPQEPVDVDMEPIDNTPPSAADDQDTNIH
jgi:hypothetical protein